MEAVVIESSVFGDGEIRTRPEAVVAHTVSLAQVRGFERRGQYAGIESHAGNALACRASDLRGARSDGVLETQPGADRVDVPQRASSTPFSTPRFDNQDAAFADTGGRARDRVGLAPATGPDTRRQAAARGLRRDAKPPQVRLGQTMRSTGTALSSMKLLWAGEGPAWRARSGCRAAVGDAFGGGDLVIAVAQRQAQQEPAGALGDLRDVAGPRSHRWHRRVRRWPEVRPSAAPTSTIARDLSSRGICQPARRRHHGGRARYVSDLESQPGEARPIASRLCGAAGAYEWSAV